MKIELVDTSKKADPVPWRKVARFAKKHPGQWVSPVGRPLNNGYATMIRTGQLVAFRPSAEWDARVINNRVCIRYVGEADRG